MSQPLAPGWYPDPGSPALLRWWDGVRWSGESRSLGQAGPAGAAPAGPPAVLAPGSVGPGAQSGTAGGNAGPGGGLPGRQASWRAPALESWAARYEQATPGRRRWRLGFPVWLIAVVVGVTVAAGAAAWYLVSVR